MTANVFECPSEFVHESLCYVRCGLIQVVFACLQNVLIGCVSKDNALDAHCSARLRILSLSRSK